jgi:hypothetical protein
MKKKIIGIYICIVVLTVPTAVVNGTTNNETSRILEIAREQSGFSQKQIDTDGCSTNWSETAKLTASDGAAYDYFGRSFSISGEYLIIGAYGDDTGRGSSYVFKRQGTSWLQETKLVASDGAPGDYFGYSVSIDGDYAVITAPGDDSYRGSVYVFKRSGSSWIQIAKLVASDGAAEDVFGISVFLRGEYAIIGAWHDDNQRGSAYVFGRSEGGWVQEAKLNASDGVIGDHFGFSVFLDGEYAAVGAFEANGSRGSVYIFKRSGTSWTEDCTLLASDGVSFDNFGVSIWLDGEYALIGANGYDMHRGCTYVFQRSGSSWAEQTKLTASDGVIQDNFGRSVSLCDGYAIIGATGVETFQGAAYVFRRSGDGWIQQQKLMASDGAIEDNFGHTVLVSDYYIFVNAYEHDTSAGANAGAVYVFKRPIPNLEGSGTLSWTKVKPGDMVSGDIQIENSGEPTSELSWEIASYPVWGTWSFTQVSGYGLTPESGVFPIHVEIIAPEEKNQQFTGEIKIINTEDSSDYVTISVSLTTPANSIVSFEGFIIKLLERFPNAFPLLRHLLGY